MASSFASRGSGWISRNVSSLKESGAVMGCPERWWSHRPWWCSKSVWMLCWGMWFSGNHWWRANGWTGWSCGSFPTLAILWLKGTLSRYPCWCFHFFAFLTTVSSHSASLPWQEAVFHWRAGTVFWPNPQRCPIRGKISSWSLLLISLCPGAW